MKLRSFAVRVRDLGRAADFYAETFGVEFREVITRDGRDGRYGQLAGTMLKLVAADADEEVGGGHRLGIAVRDVAETVGRCCGSGGRLAGEPIENGVRMHATIADPDGNEIELYTL